ncbi:MULTISPECIES: phage baseplate assembly protein V [unclassified Novosphingobium]|uniref:phage baseplate assembly protein V n=1 Tax=unclassified Novosphingobium TaxID=2644732 RepID=UPI000D30C009|nr:MULTISPECIES: phage baseplate assembly protein V [unclassified Novosphingobium]PTR05475.1 phage baseplate assembly protein V [Novosphingobium sp. GV055]PUA94033.1 phage baseplate assembly protein V [Novosphingobium sp. GV061]PUB11620.1 phage baseplate assembly protein V [Novosphingobium sp. GV079]PUB37094.1 phage baseplate assembly protein V [Novosphingobium sp. GV027]
MTDDEDIPADLSTLIRLGTILSVTLNPPRCVVRYGDPDTDEDCETPPIRWVAGRAGKTRAWSPPSEDEEVVLLCPDGQIGNAIALLGLPNDNFPAPGTTLAEVTEYEDGARIGYDPQGHALTAILPAGGTATIEAPGGLVIRGNVTIDGKLSTSEDADIGGTLTASDDVIGGGKSLKTHTHPGNSQPPS